MEKIKNKKLILLYILFVLVAGIDSAISECKGKWITKAPMPTSRHGLSAVTDGQKIFVIGGGPKPGFSYSSVNYIIKWNEDIFIIYSSYSKFII